MRRKGLSVLLLSSFIVAGSLFVTNGVKRVNAENDETTLMPEGWKYETLDDAGSSRIDTPYLTAGAYKDSEKGDSLKLVRQVSAYKLHATSNYFSAIKGASYKVELFGRSDCLDDDGNILSVRVLEKKTNGTVVTTEVTSISGRQSFWTSMTGYYDTSKDCESLAIQVSASGFGNFYVNGITVRSVPLSLMSLGNFAIESKEDADEFEPLTASYLSDDAASGEKSLHLNNKGFKLRLGFIPDGTYELSAKYKTEGAKGTKTSVRLDNIDMSGERRWYADPIPESSTNGLWASYSYKFKKGPGCDITWMQIFFYGEYYIDDLAIYDEDGFNYIPDGSFEGYDMPGVSFEGDVSLSKNKDGSLVYAGCYASFNGHKDPLLIYDASTLKLEDGKTYTLSYEYRNGSGTGFGQAKLGDTVLVDACENSMTWGKKEVSFTGAINKPLTFSFGTGTDVNGGERLGYLKNISVKAQDNTECVKVAPKQFVTDPDQIGDNVFEDGDLKNTLPDTPSSDSSSPWGDQIPGESSEEPSIPSTWEPSSSSSSHPSSSASSNSSISSKPNDSKGESGGNSSSNVAMIAVSSVLVILATGGLVISVIYLTKGKKKDE